MHLSSTVEFANNKCIGPEGCYMGSGVVHRFSVQSGPFFFSFVRARRMLRWTFIRR